MINQFNQPIGTSLPDWQGARRPTGEALSGRYCRLERLSVTKHATQLYQAYALAPDARDWTYLPQGPFASLTDWQHYLSHAETSQDPMHYAVIDLTSDQAVGTIALMRTDTINGVIEVGFVTYSPLMQRSRLSTEVFSLLLEYVFSQLGFRRFEWKCDALNAPSRAAAQRFGFTFEGVFRQAIVTRSRNRDTAWFSIIDGEYPAIHRALARWLQPTNFDAHGQQIDNLAQFMAGQHQP